MVVVVLIEVGNSRQQIYRWLVLILVLVLVVVIVVVIIAIKWPQRPPPKIRGPYHWGGGLPLATRQYIYIFFFQYPKGWMVLKNLI